jgi:hypothetical protein
MTPKGRRLSVYFVISLVITCRTIMHMFEGARAIDWVMLVIEALVLILIAYEVVIAHLDRRGARMRKQATDRRSEAIRELVSKGHVLLASAPRFGENDMIVAKWKDSLRDWNVEVQTLLKSYSSQALASYNQGIPKSASFPGLAAGNVQGDYSFLLMRLDNLQNIMEKPDVYY